MPGGGIPEAELGRSLIGEPRGGTKSTDGGEDNLPTAVANCPIAPSAAAASRSKVRSDQKRLALSFREDYLHWQKQDKRIVERINKLIRETQRAPFSGVGKPEPLRHALSGFWSRQITDEHRMVYRVEGEELRIAQLRFHY